MASEPQVLVRRPFVLALGLYLGLTVMYLTAMGSERLGSHSPYNHYALQAEAWLHGRLDLGGPPPSYTGNNDFALSDSGKHYVSFPPVPALLLLPVVAAADGVEQVPDARIWGMLAGLGPALLFLALERLRRFGRSPRSEKENLLLAALFGLGTVYWFTAAQGSVWFAGHVVSVAFTCGYILLAIGARHPWLAGLALGLAVGTRPTLFLAAPLFGFELWRAAREADDRRGEDRARVLWRRGCAFASMVALVGLLLAWHNAARFGDPTEFGHRLLTVVWRERIDRWGLFSLHYLGKNLSVMLTALPFYTPERGLMVNGHGLALWLTSPFYVWALWPKKTGGLFWASAACAAAVALPNLLYQNTGWLQFGYRFSNDFAPFLFLMIAVGARPLRFPFWLLGAWSIGINALGAYTFGKTDYAHRYYVDRSQRIIHQPD